MEISTSLIPIQSEQSEHSEQSEQYHDDNQT